MKYWLGTAYKNIEKSYFAERNQKGQIYDSCFCSIRRKQIHKEKMMSAARRQLKGGMEGHWVEKILVLVEMK